MKARVALTSSTSGSILTFGSTLDTRSWIVLRMFWSPGVFFRRVVLSSIVNIPTFSLATCDGVPNTNMSFKEHG